MTHVSSNFLSTNFFEAIFAVDFEVSQVLFQNKLKRLWNDLSVKEFILLHSRHNFCSTFFLWKGWKMMISFDGFPMHTNNVWFWCHSNLLHCRWIAAKVIRLTENLSKERLRINMDWLKMMMSWIYIMVIKMTVKSCLFKSPQFHANRLSFLLLK